MDDPPEPQCHEKGQVIDDSSLEPVRTAVRPGGEQRDEDVQSDSLSNTQGGQAERGADEPAPENHCAESSEENVCDQEKKVAGDAASSFLGVVPHDSLSPHPDGMSVFYKKHCPGARMALEQDEVLRRYIETVLCITITP